MCHETHEEGTFQISHSKDYRQKRSLYVLIYWKIKEFGMPPKLQRSLLMYHEQVVQSKSTDTSIPKKEGNRDTCTKDIQLG